MKHENPTAVRLGMTGEFVGKRYRVAGRLVMCMEEGGETYYWNEFHLIADDGSCATLVHEETDRGAEWRMFTLIDPANPMTVADAATKRIGDSVNITGKPLRVTCVDESRVCHIEGEAPEDVEMDDVARYFNAESGSEMIVVSWTGDEIEFYRGVTFPSHAVMSAFGIANVPSVALRPLSGAAPRSGVSTKLIVGIISVLLAVGLYWFFNSSRGKSSAPPKPPKAQLAVGKSGQLNSTNYRVTGRAVVEVARVGKRFLRHEYVVTDDGGNEALLIQSADKGEDEWSLLIPFQPERPLTPQQAGANKLGDTVQFAGTPANVTEMFLSRVQSVEGSTPFVSGVALYGFFVRSGSQTFVTRWNDTMITFYCVIRLTGKNVGAAFK